MLSVLRHDLVLASSSASLSVNITLVSARDLKPTQSHGPTIDN